MAVLLLLAVAAIAVCSNSVGNLMAGFTPVEQMTVAGAAVFAIMGLGTDLVIRLSER